MDNIQGIVKMEVPFFQTPNNIFDLDINVKAPKTKKAESCKEAEFIVRPIKHYEKLVYIYFCRCANNGGRAFPSYNTIAKKCGISRRTAIEAISVLKNNKLIIKKDRKKSASEQDTNEYWVLPPSAPAAPQGSAPDSPPSAPAAPQGSAPDSPPSAPAAPKKEPYKNNYIEKEPYKKIYSDVIHYLNEKAGTNYRATTKKTQDLIKARINEGFTVEDFYKVIDNKVTEWTGKFTTEGVPMENFLRPQTLFGTKFEGYLNQRIGGANNGSSGQNTETSTSECYDFSEYGG